MLSSMSEGCSGLRLRCIVCIRCRALVRVSRLTLLVLNVDYNPPCLMATYVFTRYEDYCTDGHFMLSLYVVCLYSCDTVNDLYLICFCS